MIVEDVVRAYILENFLFTDDQAELINSDSFLEKGIVDSTGVLEIIAFIEEEFNLTIEDEEMLPENLDSVEFIVKFIQSKQTS